MPVHVLRVDGPAATDGRPHLYGRQGTVPQQHLRRATVADAQIGVRLPARLGDRVTGPRPHSKMDGVLQQDETAFRPWRQAACRDLLAGNRSKAIRPAGAESSLIYAENCPSIGE